VPELSRFFGIVIRMFVEAGGQHHRAHFHAYYQEQAAVFAVDTVECLGGSLPKAQQRLVEAWAEIHRAELQQDWDLLQSGQPPVKIEPPGRWRTRYPSCDAILHRRSCTLTVRFTDDRTADQFPRVLRGAVRAIAGSGNV
jgi:hypothetical protein